MTDGAADHRASIEREVAALPGVRALYPRSALPGAHRVEVTERAETVRCELRIAADRDVPAVELVRAVGDAARRASGLDALRVRIEIASID